MHSFPHLFCRLVAPVGLALLLSLSGPQQASATDYFLTIGGGYNRNGNQASLEANVVFFQQLLAEQHRGPRQHHIFFADGHDPAADLQIVAEKPAKSETPATDLLAALHRRGGGGLDVTYRNHQVPDIAGPLDPELIRKHLETLAQQTRQGDRLIIYVTSHGSEGPEDDQFNTHIDCWNERQITVRELSKWLDKLPSDVPVVMVMAQCYCGGFARAIFQELSETKGLSPQLRIGFFAQQHDLPAAGCRPDIEHDEEFSSYFWGALAGRSRNGVPIEGCDVNNDGRISFAEAYAYAVIAGETIDIPLRSSEILLRAYSRLKPVEKSDQPADDAEAAETPDTDPKAEQALVTLTGSLQSFVDRSRPAVGRIVSRLSETLGFTLDDDIAAVQKAYDEHRRSGRSQGRRGRRPGSGRRELLAEVAAKWPDLGDPRKWRDSELLKADNQEKLLAELQALPTWKPYEERLKQRETAGDESERNELRSVKFRRLISTLETIVLEQNLPACATPEVVTRYQQMLQLEDASLTP